MNYMYVKKKFSQQHTCWAETNILILQSNSMKLNYMNRKLIKNKQTTNKRRKAKKKPLKGKITFFIKALKIYNFILIFE